MKLRLVFLATRKVGPEEMSPNASIVFPNNRFIEIFNRFTYPPEERIRKAKFTKAAAS
jgi:hypothetical protein